jgi:hypothetical protein
LDKKIPHSGLGSRQLARPTGSRRGQGSGQAGKSHRARGARGAGKARQQGPTEGEEHLEGEHFDQQEELRQLRTVGHKDQSDGQHMGQGNPKQSLLNKLQQKKGLPPKPELPQVKAAKRDGFERLTAKKQEELKKTEHAKLSVPVTGPPPEVKTLTGALHFLNQAQPPGVLFKVDPDGQRQGRGEEGSGEEEEEEKERAWQEAVDETSRKLHGLRGITRVVRGYNEGGDRVVLVMVEQGLTHQSFDNAIPVEVQGFPTLVALPYEALPLRREWPISRG